MCVLSGVYASGWVATGAHGVLPATVVDAVLTNYFSTTGHGTMRWCHMRVSCTGDTLVPYDMGLESVPRVVKEGFKER